MKFKVLGVNDDRDTCECCGKSNLKKVVWVENTETSEVKHFGVNCAQNPEKGFDKQAVLKEIKKYESLVESCWFQAHRQYKASGGQYDVFMPSYKMVPRDRELLESIFDNVKKEKLAK